MMIVLVLLFRWNDDLCSSASGMTRHTLHTTHNTPFVQASINRNSTMVSTHIRSAEGRKTDTLTHGHNSSYMKFSRVPLHVFWSFTTRKSGDFSSVASRLFSPGILKSKRNLKLKGSLGRVNDSITLGGSPGSATLVPSSTVHLLHSQGQQLLQLLRCGLPPPFFLTLNSNSQWILCCSDESQLVSSNNFVSLSQCI